MLNTETATVPISSGRPLVPLNTADTYSLSSTNGKPFQTNSNLNATASPRQTIYQPHTAPHIGPSSTLPPSSSTVNPMNPSRVITKRNTITFASTN